MTVRTLVGLGALLAASTLIAQQAVSQDKPAPAKNPHEPSPEEMAKMMEKWMKVAAPSDHHKKLEPFVGKWDVVTRMWMAGPNAPPTETKGTSEVKWIMDGRFIMEELTGEMMGQPWKGLGFTGYDNYKNMYVATWMDNLGTHILSMKGGMDPAGKTLTFYGEMDEPMLDIQDRMVRYVTKIIDADTHKFEIFDLHAGPDYKVVEVEYKRRK